MSLISINNGFSRHEYRNDFTKELDKHVVEEQIISIEMGGGSYIWVEKDRKVINNEILFRFPGATRGWLEVDDNNVIKAINFNKSNSYTGGMACYKESVVEAVQKYIGMKIIIEGE